MLDWSMYSDRIDPRIEGDSYDYDINNVPETDMEELWDLVEEHYNRTLDVEWSM